MKHDSCGNCKGVRAVLPRVCPSVQPTDPGLTG
jgi:hypothetical protein